MIASGTFVILGVAAALFSLGLIGLVSRSHLIKLVMGLQFIEKSACLVFILGGYLSGIPGISQTVVFIIIAIEAVVTAVALALVIVIRQFWNTFDYSRLTDILRGGGN
ncbi:MAG TPA: NADH-quinone oxidoreductase subunit K [Methanoregulaceae archaeon]|nr:NADH-quinone oxidoreductase subunit K [Methanoregulaceae archaeon]